MSYLSSERPGVYSSFDASSVVSGRSAGKTAAVIARAQSGDAGTVYSFTNLVEAEAAFGAATAAAPMSELVRLLFLNGAPKVLAVRVSGDGNATDAYKAAIALLSEEDAGVVLCDSEEIAVQQALRDMVKGASEERRERVCVVSLSSAATASSLAARAEALNSERCVLVGPAAVSEGSADPSGVYLAAATAGVIASAADPALPFNGAVLLGLSGLSQRYSDSDITALVQGGVTPCECVAGEVSFVRAVTTRTKTGGAPDKTWRELTTILVADDVISTVRNALRAKFTRAKNTESVRTAIKSQVVVELEKKKNAQIIDGYAGVSAVKSEEDAGICIVDFEFAVARGLNQIYLRAHILV